MVDIEETNIGVHALLVTKNGKIILQQRDNKPEIINPGLISMFGGTVKAKGSLEQELKRELEEELEISIQNYPIEPLGVFYKTKGLDGIDYEINVFVIKEIELERLKLHEGIGFVCDFPNGLLKNDKLTRITRLAVEKYIGL